MQHHSLFPRSIILLAVLASLGLAACGGSSSNDDSATTSGSSDTYVIPAPPAGVGYAEAADTPSGVLAYVDTGATNQTAVCTATLDTNAGVRVLKGMLDIWTPVSLLVDNADYAASGSCAAITKTGWDGLTGTVKNQSIHDANLQYVIDATKSRSTTQALAAYMDDRRQKGYSVSDGMGPLTSIWRTGTAQSTSIAAVDPNTPIATAINDGGNNLGSTTSTLGQAVTFLGSGNISDGSTNSAKYFYKYARPWRWSSSVVVVPALESAKNTITPATDGGFNSGHTAEAWRDVLPMAYLFPQRYQELISRAMELGENRILAGMHSPLDVMGGRIQATAVVAYSLNKTALDKAATYSQVQNYLMTQTGTSDFNALNTYAHTLKTTDATNADYDRFSDYATNKANYTKRLTYGLPKIAANDGKAATVPKGAEVLLETRQPYLTAAQRRVVLKTTEIDSGYPLSNDDEGWGRLNLFAAADGYGAFNGDVSVTMDASLGGFNALDTWRNDISGAGKLSKLGTGSLHLAGNNSFTGGTLLNAGTLAADSVNALGKGDVYVSGGTLLSNPAGTLAIIGNLTQLSSSTLHVALRSNSQGTLAISGSATLAGGALHVSFPGSYKPAVGDVITVMSAAKRYGSFTSITVDGFKATPIYTATSVQLRITG